MEIDPIFDNVGLRCCLAPLNIYIYIVALFCFLFSLIGGDVYLDSCYGGDIFMLWDIPTYSKKINNNNKG